MLICNMVASFFWPSPHRDGCALIKTWSSRPALPANVLVMRRIKTSSDMEVKAYLHRGSDLEKTTANYITRAAKALATRAVFSSFFLWLFILN
jgi:hypothetical protein